jgi:hypothetical protein
MRHAHRLIIGEVQAEATGDLLRAPALSPTSVLARSLTPPTPCDIWTRDAPIRPLHRPRKPVLHIAPQLRIHRQLRRLGTLSATLSMPLGGRGSIFNAATSDRSVALQLSADRRRRANQPTRDLSHPTTSSEPDRDLLALGERQITPGRRREAERRHAATLAEPPDTNVRQDARLDRSLFARCTSGDRLPEPDAMLPSTRRRMSAPTRPGCSGTIQSSVSPRHDNSSTSGVATTT